MNYLRSSLCIAAFGQGRIGTSLDDQFKSEISAHNQKARRNTKIINAICFVDKQELPFRGHDKTENSVIRGNYVELVKYTAKYDPPFADNMEIYCIQGTV